MDRIETTQLPRSATERVRKPLLRGVHHLALNTDDMRATLDFYVRILGMPLLGGLRTGPGGAERAQTRGNPPYSHIPHYFLDMGGDSTLAFFEYPKGVVGKADRDTIAAMQHVSFVCKPSLYRQMEQRLKENGVEIVFGPKAIVTPNIHSMYFYDPNGIRLEISADMDGNDDDLAVVRSFTLSREAMRRELETISDDAAWIEGMLDCMPEEEPLYKRDKF